MPHEGVLRVRGIPKANTTNNRFLLEQPPDYHLIHRNKGYYVPLPWTYYYVTNELGYYGPRELFVSPVRIRLQSDWLCLSPMLNLAYGRRPCFHYNHWAHRKESSFDNIACGMQDWWDAHSNNDYWHDMVHLNREVCETLAGCPLTYTAGSLTKMLQNWQKTPLETMAELPWKRAKQVKDYKLRLVDRPFINDESLER